MSRTTKAVTGHRRHRKIVAKASGYDGMRSRSFRVAKQAVVRAEQYAYRDRKVRKRQFRRLWILRINAAARQHGLTYSRFIEGISKASVEVNRKALADLAISDAVAFGALVEVARKHLQPS